MTIDRSAANGAAIEQLAQEDLRPEKKKIRVRQVKYLNNIVEQDHRFIKRVVKPMQGFKSFISALKTLAGIELMHMLRKKQHEKSSFFTPSQLFYRLAG